MATKFTPVQMLSAETLVLSGSVFTRLWFRLLEAVVKSAGIRFVTSGSGDPNGNVSAALGTLYIDTTGGLWVKETEPTPSTGWVLK